MTRAPDRFPLAWPAGRARTKGRKTGQFRKSDRPIGSADATLRVEQQLEALGGRYALLSSNLELRLDGRPRADRGEPSDPGVCLYFELKGKPLAMACDTYTKVAQNIAAIAAHLEATRAIARYGVATAEEVLQNFQALPPPPAGGSIQIGETPSAPWWDFFGLVRETATEEAVTALYRAKARAAVGDDAALLVLNLQRDAAIADIRGPQ